MRASYCTPRRKGFENKLQAKETDSEADEAMQSEASGRRRAYALEAALVMGSREACRVITHAGAKRVKE